jgi:hypothetical protein
MKSLQLLIISSLIILLAVDLSAQDCPDFDLVFNTQLQIDNYKANYPDCTFFDHSIHIEGDDIMDFSAFDKLKYVDGLFYIGDCNLIDSISSFNQLDSVGGRLSLTSNF